MGSDETALVLMKFIQSETLFITVLSLRFYDLQSQISHFSHNFKRKHLRVFSCS